MHCDDGKATCSCYMYAKPWEFVSYDADGSTMIGYQCSDMRDAVNSAYVNLGSPAYLANIITWFGNTFNNYHYSLMAVAS